MSSSDRRLFLARLGAGTLGLGAAVGLGGCGFTPVYGPGGSAAGLRGRIRVGDPKSRRGFMLVGRLEERLGRPSAPDFELDFKLGTRSEGVAISSSNDIERYQLFGNVDFTLRPLGGTQVLTTGRVRSFTSYSTTSLTVGTLAAEEDAYDRLMVSLADLVVAELLATAVDWNAGGRAR
ncbi:hypothetical protein BV394_08470 [Brevirhabdus pacifica]|uniref:Uncharacterized protein n=1 Tax=Brevirhabdus pacifica TaxID=1267768 RepID=A0A1U7DID3_9RHOB|nr:LPS assembly lipoprotein LptE [Brevirhabdus pacifica]APX89746.1 hypothetical protein BV394_08470 [Brevirhabdus pacifica]OWU74583.1 hypothetical protein ATO5_13110 [Loktanella sp. 22II-4b]PJJ85563.1 LPS-assembly lipoprotein [Brevirhabdus pacifica]